MWPRVFQSLKFVLVPSNKAASCCCILDFSQANIALVGSNCVLVFFFFFSSRGQMYRIKDPKASLDFYSRVLGMRYEMQWPNNNFHGILFLLSYWNFTCNYFNFQTLVSHFWGLRHAVKFFLWVSAKWEVGHVVGFSLLEKYDFPDAKFTVYFLGYEVCKHCQLQASLETDILPGVHRLPTTTFLLFRGWISRIFPF